MAAVVVGYLEYLTVESVIKFIGKLAVTTTIGWFTQEAVKDFFGPSAETRRILFELEEESKKIRDILTNDDFHQRWEKLNEDLIITDEEITYRCKLLNTYTRSDTNESEESKEDRWKVFRREIEAGTKPETGGIYSQLFRIDFLLAGESETDSRVGLLKLWSENVYEKMLENPMSAKTYYDTLMKYMKKVAVLQSQGAVLLQGSSDNCYKYQDAIQRIERNVKRQYELLNKTIPKATQYLVNPKPNLFILSVGNDVIYGPPVGGGATHHKLTLRNRHDCNEDEEWIFEQSPSYDKDGSLLISENSKKLPGHSGGYIRLYDGIPCCDANRREASSFYVMPLHPINGEFEVCIWVSEEGVQGFLQSDTLRINYGRQNIRFVLTPFQHPKNDK